MKNEEIIDTLRLMMNLTRGEQKAIRKAIDALNDRIVYRWHDLKADPTDLPDDDNESDFFIVALYGKHNNVTYEGAVDVAMYCYDGTWDVEEGLEVRAWKQIEKFVPEVMG